MRKGNKVDRKALVLNALRDNGGNISGACRTSHVDRRTYYRWLRRDGSFAREVEKLTSQNATGVENATGVAHVAHDGAVVVSEGWSVEAKALLERIVGLLRGQDKYTDELVVQAGVTARLLVSMERIERLRSDPDYSPVVTETSREGNDRLVAHPLERLYLEHYDRVQRGLRSLSMNFDGKERKGGGDSLEAFLKEFGG